MLNLKSLAAKEWYCGLSFTCFAEFFLTASPLTVGKVKHCELSFNLEPVVVDSSSKTFDNVANVSVPF